MPDFGQNTGNGARVARVNTNSIAMFASDSTMLRFSMADETLFISIIPKVDDPNGGKGRWPKELGHTVGLKAYQAMSLYKGFVKSILPDIEAGKDHEGHCVVPLNRESSNLCGFSYAGERATFTIFYNVGVDRTCAESYSFVFSPTMMIDGYNPVTGSYTLMPVQGQLFVALEALRCFGDFAVNVPGHCSKTALAWNFDGIMSHLRAIANKLGATPAEYGQYHGTMGGNTFGMDSGFGSGGFGAASFGSVASPGMAQQSPLNVPSPYSDETPWGNSGSTSAQAAQPNATAVEQLSSLDDLMKT